MTRLQIEKRINTICGKLENLQADLPSSASRELKEAIANSKKEAIRALSKV